MTNEETKLLLDRGMSDSISERETQAIKERLNHPSELIRALEMTSLLAKQAYKPRNN